MSKYGYREAKRCVAPAVFAVNERFCLAWKAPLTARPKQVLYWCSRRGKRRPAFKNARLYITANDRNRPWTPDTDQAMQSRTKHSSECAEGILDGIRLICKTSMDGCGWCIRRILECTISLLILENGIPTCLCTISLKKIEFGLHKREFCSPFPLFFRVLVHR